MFEFDITYKSRKSNVRGPDKVYKKTIEEIFDFIRAVHVEVDNSVVEEFQNKKLFPIESDRFQTIVDGKASRNKNLVKAFGKIVNTRKIEDFSKVILFAFNELQKTQVSSSGYYASNNYLVYNGQVVAKNIFSVNAWLKTAQIKQGDRIRILNPTPYARKLEREGKKISKSKKDNNKKINSKRMKKSKVTGGQVLAANGSFWITKNTIRRKFPVLRNSVYFSFIPLASSIAKSLNSKEFSRYTFKQDNRDYLYPSITIIIGNGNFSPANAGLTEASSKL